MQGLTGVPPPHTPPLHVLPVVHGSWSSHAAPSGAGVHTDGEPVQVKQGSTWHRAAPPPPPSLFPRPHWHRPPPAPESTRRVPQSGPKIARSPTSRESPTSVPANRERQSCKEPLETEKDPFWPMLPVSTP